jgi:polyvinyl alcohol dehydrogenase (cytochrome)
VPDSGFVSVANGVVYAGSNAATGTNMYGLDASTGAILWSFASGGEVRSGAAIVGAKVFWGSGYRGGENDKLYAFGIPAGRAAAKGASFRG